MAAKQPGHGHVFLFNPSEDDMEFDDNPRKRRRRKKSAGKKRKAHKRSNPAPKLRRRRRRASAAAPAAPRRRRRRASSVARRASAAPRRRRFRRNPSSLPFKSMGVAALGGGIARGAVHLAEKIPVTNAYLALGIKAAAPAFVAIGAGFAGMERIAMGAAGAFGFQAPDLAISAYNTYKATQPAAKTPGQQGLGSVRQIPQSVAARQGFGSIRMASGAVVRPR